MAFPAVLQSKIHVASIPQLTQDNLRDSEFKLDLPNPIKKICLLEVAITEQPKTVNLQ